MGFHFGHLCGRYTMNAKAARCLVSAARYRIAYLELAREYMPPHITPEMIDEGIAQAREAIDAMERVEHDDN